MIWATYTFRLVILTFLLFLLQRIPGFTSTFFLVPALLPVRPWTLVTAAFLHASLFHWFFNVWGLMIFGSVIEQRLGRKLFLTILLSGAIFGNIGYAIYMLLFGDPFIPGLGLSGALFGLIGAITILFPSLIVYWFGFPVPMSVAGVLWVLFEILALGAQDMIAHSAHLAGWLAGAFIGAKLREEAMRGFFIGYFDVNKLIRRIALITILISILTIFLPLFIFKAEPPKLGLKGWVKIKEESYGYKYEAVLKKNGGVVVLEVMKGNLRALVKHRFEELSKEKGIYEYMEQHDRSGVYSLLSQQNGKLFFSMGKCNEFCVLFTGIVESDEDYMALKDFLRSFS